VQQVIAVQANPLICALKLQKSSVCKDGLLSLQLNPNQLNGDRLLLLRYRVFSLDLQQPQLRLFAYTTK